MESKLLIVTGGSRGIGRQIALCALAAGWRVAVSYKDHKAAAEDLVRDSGGRARAFHMDVAVPQSIAGFFAEISATMGCSTALVNSAGIDLGPAHIGGFNPDLVARTMAVNIVGLILCCNEFVSHLRRLDAAAGAAIVNVSSMASTIGGRSGKTVYAASKGAVDVFTIGMAKELAAEKISVFAVRPGVTVTDMTSHLLSDPENAKQIKSSIACKEPASPEDIARPIMDLISGRFAYASGALINMSGGGLMI